MNLKKLGLPVLCCGAAFLTSCGYTYASKRTLTYADAKEWVKNNYGEGVEGQRKYEVPTKATSEWAFVGNITSWGKSAPSKYQRRLLINHITNFFNEYSYITADEVTKTVKDLDIPEGEYSMIDEFAFKTDERIKNDIEMIGGDDGNFHSMLDYASFDYTMDYLFKDMAKYNADYNVDNASQTLVVKGTFAIGYFDKNNNGEHYYRMPGCSVTFDKKGRVTNINFNFNKDTLCNYVWVSHHATKAEEYSGSFSWIMMEGGKIDISFEY